VARYTCQDVRDRLWDLLDGDLVGAARADVEAHLATCQACRREAAVRRRLWEALGLDAVPESPDLTQRILNRVAGERLRSAHRRRVRWMAVAAAACLVIGLTLTLALWPPSAAEPVPLPQPYLETQLVSLDQVSDIELLLYSDFLEPFVVEEPAENGI
jgi:anti-sigma factor RsiW